MLRIRYGWLLLVTCVIISSASGRGALGTLGGTVVNAAGMPVANASVTVQTSDGLHPHATHTDSSGHFRFVRFVRGQYDLRAATAGAYSEWSKRILVRPGKTTEVVLRLTK